MLFIFYYELIYAISQKFEFVFLKKDIFTVKYWRIHECIGVFDEYQNFKNILKIGNENNSLDDKKIYFKKVVVLKFHIPKYILSQSDFLKTYLETSLNRNPIYLSNIISLEGFETFISLIHSRKLFIYFINQKIFCGIFRLLDYLQISESLTNQYFYVNLIQSVVTSKIIFDEKIICELFASLPNNFLLKNFLILFSYLVRSIKILDLRNDKDINKYSLGILKIHENVNNNRRILILKDNDVVYIMNNVENIWYRNIFKQFIHILLSVQIRIQINVFHVYTPSKLKLFSELFSVQELQIEGYYSYIFVPYLIDGPCKSTLRVLNLCGSRISERIFCNILKLKILQHLFLISCSITNVCYIPRFRHPNTLHLKYLDFSRTHITIKEIYQIYNLSQLEKIEMYGSNLVAGTVGFLKGCKFKSSLKHLNLANNFLNEQDISVIFLFSNLYHLDLTGCNLIDSNEIIYDNIACTNLKFLNLTYVNLNENLMKALNCFKSLEILTMNLVHYNGVIFKELNTCYIAETLIELNLSHKCLIVSDFHKIFLMKNLKRLNLTCTVYHSQENEIYSNLDLPDNLDVLDLRNNDLKNGNVFNFQNLEHLKELNLNFCNLSSLEFFEKSPFLFKNLEKLSLANNSFSETNLNILKKFKMLKFLNISKAYLKNWRIANLKDSLISKTLEYFDFRENGISYDDFLAVKSFKNLKNVRLFYCKMTFRDLNDQDILFLRNVCSIEIQNILYIDGNIIFHETSKHLN
ncbi:hypothetical protein CWI38_0045p0050 [Hamiltosporidium tvaerminnensis]|uniref:Leucine-rich repeat-containing protein n=2 Tax=Hamiltosporidium TaxID=1176354 RepID=A0A4Q9LBX1_9MICR|nr:hypothetical protein LUQ84_000316 [Hamiltosporidium tvaerminnensis]TBU05234.1 hypothetical protein CWI37_0033p0030 [Hamiltosporidium tvaerminnensis]TBU20611.1 hypothetical protein CWI38_0045p0050 [Hamiltosporidium tvaerminnensis]